MVFKRTLYLRKLRHEFKQHILFREGLRSQSICAERVPCDDRTASMALKLYRALEVSNVLLRRFEADPIDVLGYTLGENLTWRRLVSHKGHLGGELLRVG